LALLLLLLWLHEDEAQNEGKQFYSLVLNQKLDCYRLIAAFKSQLIIYYCIMQAMRVLIQSENQKESWKLILLSRC
jgi:hypothetical protein